MRTTKFFLFSFALVALLLVPSISLAYQKQNVQFEPQDPGVITGEGAVTTNSISQYSGLGQQDPVDITVMIVNWLLGFLGIVFLVLIVYAGIRWMISAGDDEAITKSKNIIKGAVIGLVIILAAYGITYFIFEFLVNATNSRF